MVFNFLERKKITSLVNFENVLSLYQNGCTDHTLHIHHHIKKRHWKKEF